MRNQITTPIQIPVFAPVDKDCDAEVDLDV